MPVGRSSAAGLGAGKAARPLDLDPHFPKSIDRSLLKSQRSDSQGRGSASDQRGLRSQGAACTLTHTVSGSMADEGTKRKREELGDDDGAPADSRARRDEAEAEAEAEAEGGDEAEEEEEEEEGEEEGEDDAADEDGWDEAGEDEKDGGDEGDSDEDEGEDEDGPWLFGVAEQLTPAELKPFIQYSDDVRLIALDSTTWPSAFGALVALRSQGLVAFGAFSIAEC